MGKMAYVSVTYLFSFEPKNFYLEEDCSKEEFDEATNTHMEEMLSLIQQATGLNYNDLEITILE